MTTNAIVAQVTICAGHRVGLVFAESHACRLSPAPRGMKIPMRRLVNEFDSGWCLQPERKSETGGLTKGGIFGGGQVWQMGDSAVSYARCFIKATLNMPGFSREPDMKAYLDVT